MAPASLQFGGNTFDTDSANDANPASPAIVILLIDIRIT